MKILRVGFEFYEGNVEDLPPGYQEVSFHIIFDVMMGENFRHKDQMLAGVHKTTTESSLTYSSMVSRDSAWMALTIYVLNDLMVLVCDIHNSYLTEKYRE